jgi:hypothetical protein
MEEAEGAALIGETGSSTDGSSRESSTDSGNRGAAKM